MSTKTELYKNFQLIEKAVAEGLWTAVKYARGSCVSFTPKKVLEYANVSGQNRRGASYS